jgi:hypothetical protein
LGTLGRRGARLFSRAKRPLKMHGTLAGFAIRMARRAGGNFFWRLGRDEFAFWRPFFHVFHGRESQDGPSADSEGIQDGPVVDSRCVQDRVRVESESSQDYVFWAPIPAQGRNEGWDSGKLARLHVSVDHLSVRPLELALPAGSCLQTAIAAASSLRQ